MTIYHYSGAGNNFVVLDARFETPKIDVKALCEQYRTDGLMLLKHSPDYDFEMIFYNPDGSSGMMCGNGGRCIVAFAALMGITPHKNGTYKFLAADGEHSARILETSQDRKECTVELKMIDVREFRPSLDGGWFLNTGTRHFVQFRPDVEDIDIDTEGPRYRCNPEFAPEGTNVNFVQLLGGSHIKVRTFEKGVEGETLACGTGITASAMAAFLQNGTQKEEEADYKVEARINSLEVRFRFDGKHFREVYLTGPAELLQKIEL